MPQAEKKEKRLEVTFPGGSRVACSIDGWVIETDQPGYAGGEGSAPAPFQHFLSSLANCFGYYALAFCQSRDIPTEGLRLTTVCEKNREQRRYDVIRFELELPEGFPERYTRAIQTAMLTCSIKRHFEYPPEFRTLVLPARRTGEEVVNS